jgi:hypothetical protein
LTFDDVELGAKQIIEDEIIMKDFLDILNLSLLKNKFKNKRYVQRAALITLYNLLKFGKF